MQNHQRINASSGKVDFWTPQPIIEAARKTLGGIQLDPASSHAANERVRAVLFFNERDDGLARYWGAPSSPSTVFLNMPFRRETNARWVNHLIGEYSGCRVSAACCITFASTSEAWFKPLLNFPQCFLVPRTNYLTPDGKIMRGVTKGSVVTYLGPDVDKFALEFAALGAIKVKYVVRLPYGPCQCAICQDGMVDYWCQNCQNWFRAEQTPVHAPEPECPKCKESNTYEADTE